MERGAVPRCGRGSDEVRAQRRTALDIAFPEGEWNVSGLVVKVPGAAPKFPVLAAPKPLPRPVFTHIPPHMFVPGRPLTVALGGAATAAVKSVRLHYRPLNQLAKFKTLEAAPGREVFTLPPEELTRFDLLPTSKY
jgi:hypothetical protein